MRHEEAFKADRASAMEAKTFVGHFSMGLHRIHRKPDSRKSEPDLDHSREPIQLRDMNANRRTFDW